MMNGSRYGLRGLALALAVLCLSLPVADAHRQGLPLTRIEWNARTQVWEVTHRVNIHDVGATIPAVAQMASLQTPETLNAIDRLIRADFAIIGDVELDYIGAERDGDHVYAYYELRAHELDVRIDSALLLKTRPVDGHAAPEACLVNVMAAGGLQSRVFRAGDGPEDFRLVPPR